VLRIGLTGGIASGKTTVANMFADCGASIIDTDVIARDLVRPGTSSLAEIRRQFGDGVISGDGSLNRAALRKIVFDDEASRIDLENILHPRIREVVMRSSALVDGPYQIIVVPLLIESPLRDFVDRIVVVDCDAEIQLKRLLSRDSETPEQAKRIIAAQSSRQSRIDIADDIITNDGRIDDTRKQVDALHRYYLKLAESSSSRP
jgi:dephospho-CoA kinase